MLVAVVAVGVTLAGLALGRLKLGGPLGIRAVTRTPSGGSASPVSLAIKGARDFDPQGDGSEHPEAVPLAIDGNPATAWTTTHYNSAAFGNLKSGVGLWIDLGESPSVTRVVLTSTLPGWTFQLEAGTLQHLSAPLQSTAGARTFTIGGNGRAVVDLRTVRAPGILIWITRLAPDGGRSAATLADLTVSGAAG